MHPVTDLLVCLRLFSRLPVPTTRRETELGGQALAAAAAMVPVAGAVVGLIAALVLAAGLAIGLPHLLAASLAVTALMLTTGAFHEDGLADCADGFGGGRTVARKLEIMRDSRIGTFGTCAIGLSLLIRISAIGAVGAHGALTGAMAIVLAASVSRTACLLPLAFLPPARCDGLGAAAGRPSPSLVLAAFAIATGLGLCLTPFGLGLARLVVAVSISVVAGVAVCAVAQQQIRGQTGDVAGAAQQVAEMAVLAVIAAA